MHIKFYLDKPQQKKSPIIASISFKRNRIRCGTGIVLPIIHWDSDKQRVKRSHNDSLLLNSTLEALKSEVLKIYSTLALSGVDWNSETVKDFKRRIDDFRNPQTIQPIQELTFVQHFEKYILVSKTTKKPNTIVSYETTKTHLKGFEAAYNLKLTFEMMDVMFYEKFLRYLFNVVGVSNNTAGKEIKNLKTFLRYATEAGLNDKLKFTQFKVLQEEVTTVSLTNDELKRIEELDLTGNDPLHRARNLFLLECYTGLRYSDVKQLKPENVRGSFLILHTVKTKDNLPIPLITKAQNILKDYFTTGKKPIPVRRINEYIREFAALAGINEPIQTVSHRGTERLEKTVPKHQLITSHTGRRTFVTLSLEKGMRPEIVMRVTGHKDTDSFKRYVRLTDKITEMELLRAWDGQPEPVGMN